MAGFWCGFKWLCLVFPSYVFSPTRLVPFSHVFFPPSLLPGGCLGDRRPALPAEERKKETRDGSVALCLGGRGGALALIKDHDPDLNSLRSGAYGIYPNPSTLLSLLSED